MPYIMRVGCFKTDEVLLHDALQSTAFGFGAALPVQRFGVFCLAHTYT
jgi:hypothetical protein